MKMVDHEPVVSVGLMTGAESVVFELKGAFVNSAGERLDGGSYRATPFNNGVEIVSEGGPAQPFGFGVSVNARRILGFFSCPRRHNRD